MNKWAALGEVRRQAVVPRVPFRFLDLPLELRRLVYRHLISGRHVVNLGLHAVLPSAVDFSSGDEKMLDKHVYGWTPHRAALGQIKFEWPVHDSTLLNLNIAFVSKAISNEFLEYAYRHMVFDFYLDQPCTGRWDPWAVWSETRSKIQHARLVRHRWLEEIDDEWHEWASRCWEIHLGDMLGSCPELRSLQIRTIMSDQDANEIDLAKFESWAKYLKQSAHKVENTITVDVPKELWTFSPLIWELPVHAAPRMRIDPEWPLEKRLLCQDLPQVISTTERVQITQ